jgi:hypothetical protein
MFTASSWHDMRYYPIKALWTASVVVMPLAVGGALICVRVAVRAIGGLGSRPARLAWGGALVCLLALAAADLVGRGMARQGAVGQILAGTHGGVPGWVAMLEDLEARASMPDWSHGAMVFGMAPNGSALSLKTGDTGVADFVAMEALGLVGAQGTDTSPVKVYAYLRNEDAVCQWLAANPLAVRLTGPNPVTGAQWLMAAGCPQAVVKPSRWLSTRLDAAWLQGTPAAGAAFTFPSYEQYKSEVK